MDLFTTAAFVLMALLLLWVVGKHVTRVVKSNSRRNRVEDIILPAREAPEWIDIKTPLDQLRHWREETHASLRETLRVILEKSKSRAPLGVPDVSFFSRDPAIQEWFQLLSTALTNAADGADTEECLTILMAAANKPPSVIPPAIFTAIVRENKTGLYFEVIGADNSWLDAEWR